MARGVVWVLAREVWGVGHQWKKVESLVHFVTVFVYFIGYLPTLVLERSPNVFPRKIIYVLLYFTGHLLSFLKDYFIIGVREPSKPSGYATGLISMEEKRQ